MNLDAIETLLVAQLARLFRRRADVRPGPVAALPLGGMRETVFVHASRFEDHGGVTPDGATIGRRPVRRGRVAGIAEERPSRIILEITCIAASYARVKALAEAITPTVLVALASEREFALGASANRLASVKFADFQPSLSLAETMREEDGDLSYHSERLVFHLDGALHVLLSKRDGLRPRAPVRAPTPTARKTRARPATRARTRRKK